MTGPELIALGHAAITKAHELILLGGMLGLLSIIAGLISRRVGAPMLLVFLALGMLAGEDGVLGIPYDDLTSAYLIGSVALAVILFEGGLKTPALMLRLAFWPATVLATIGVALTAAILGIFVSLVDGVPSTACRSSARCWQVPPRRRRTRRRLQCCCGAPAPRSRSGCLLSSR